MKNPDQVRKNVSKPASVSQGKSPKQPAASKRAVIISPAFDLKAPPVMEKELAEWWIERDVPVGTHVKHMLAMSDVYERWAAQQRAVVRHVAKYN